MLSGLTRGYLSTYKVSIEDVKLPCFTGRDKAKEVQWQKCK